MKRRALLATASATLLGSPVLGKVLHIPAPPATPTPLPSRLGAADVAAIRRLTTELCTQACTYGGGADVVTAVAQRALPLRSVPASDEVKAEMASALAELHTIAGWCCMDSGHDDNARAHFAQAMDLAGGEDGDGYQLASALRHAGIQMQDVGAYDDDLKACQLGLIKLGVVAQDDARGQEQLAWLHGESAIALAAMGYREEALRAIATAREWTPSATFDIADLDLMTAEVHLFLNGLIPPNRWRLFRQRGTGTAGHLRRGVAALDPGPGGSCRSGAGAGRPSRLHVPRPRTPRPQDQPGLVLSSICGLAATANENPQQPPLKQPRQCWERESHDRQPRFGQAVEQQDLQRSQQE